VDAPACQELEVRESRLETELARAQLHALRLEIEPHFLFNTLNAITALVRLKENSRALEMLVGLGDFMRSNLDRPHDQLVTLATEIAWAQRYIALQQARFGERLKVQYQIADECLETGADAAAPAIVENAFRHGLGRTTHACSSRVARPGNRTP
jgi:LytS/YehU family sensor histidine kinase